MKLRSSLLLALAFAPVACESASKSAPETVSARAYFDQCAAAGWNVTFEKAFESELSLARVPVADPAKLSIEQLEAHLDRVLADAGFAADRVGPPELKMLLVRRAS